MEGSEEHPSLPIMLGIARPNGSHSSGPSRWPDSLAIFKKETMAPPVEINSKSYRFLPLMMSRGPSLSRHC